MGGNRILPSGINIVLRRSFAKLPWRDIDDVEVSPAVAFSGGMCIMAVFSVIKFKSRSCFSTTLYLFSYESFIVSRESFNASHVLVAMSS